MTIEMIQLDWNSEQNIVDGWYFVALSLGPFLGEYDVLFYADGNWQHPRPETVIAWVTEQDFLQALPASLDLPWKNGEVETANWYLCQELETAQYHIMTWADGKWQTNAEVPAFKHLRFSIALATLEIN